MKNSIVILIVIFSISGCQKNNEKEINQSTEQLPAELKNYLNIKISNDLSVSIGELASIDENIHEDYEIRNKKDTIYINKQFLESDDLDGKNIKVLSSHKKDMMIKYNVGFKFMGNEKRSNYLPINYIISKKTGSVIPPFEKIYNDTDFQKFIKKNNQEIYHQAYDVFVKYYESLPERELKSCCPADYENYFKIKKRDHHLLTGLDLKKDLMTVPDYKSIIIDIKDLNSLRTYVIVFKKDNGRAEDLSENLMTKQKINWEGVYWLYPYDIDSGKQGNYYINISRDNNEFGFSGDIQFNYKINYKSTDNKLYLFDKNQSAADPLAVIYKEENQYYIKSDLIKMKRTDLKETKNGYPISWAKSSDEVPDSPIDNYNKR